MTKDYDPNKPASELLREMASWLDHMPAGTRPNAEYIRENLLGISRIVEATENTAKHAVAMQKEDVRLFKQGHIQRMAADMHYDQVHQEAPQ
ncbi:MAG: hypothetical protein K0U36_02885 [Alphaproteobacteria bacterium]|nr:hypothetical protein [Alphaproteobacteria bacterium]